MEVLHYLHLIVRFERFGYHRPHCSSFERFLMTTTAADGSFKTENIFAPFLRPRAAKKRVRWVIIRPGAQKSPKFTSSEQQEWAVVLTCNETTAFYRVGRQEQMNYRTVSGHKITVGLI